MRPDLVTEILTDGATGISGNILQSCRVARTTGHDTSVGHGIMLFQIFHNLSNSRFFLSDSNIDTFNTGIFLPNN